MNTNTPAPATNKSHRKIDKLLDEYIENLNGNVGSGSADAATIAELRTENEATDSKIKSHSPKLAAARATIATLTQALDVAEGALKKIRKIYPRYAAADIANSALAAITKAKEAEHGR